MIAALLQSVLFCINDCSNNYQLKNYYRFYQLYQHQLKKFFKFFEFSFSLHELLVTNSRNIKIVSFFADVVFYQNFRQIFFVIGFNFLSLYSSIKKVFFTSHLTGWKIFCYQQRANLFRIRKNWYFYWRVCYNR